MHKLLQVIMSVSGRLFNCEKLITETDNSIAMRSLKGDLKIEVVTLTGREEWKRKSDYRTVGAFQV